jgi:DNA-binding response OmpR family regulator
MENFTLYRDVDEEGVSESPFISMQQRSNQHRLANVKETKLLLVDSDILAAEELGDQLALHNFLPTVVHSAKAGWGTANATQYDLIVLDATLVEGEEAGFSLAERLRKNGFHQPILFLTSRNDLPDRIRAHDNGDDHLSKPFDVLEVVAKLKALSRRGFLLPTTYTWRELELIPEERKVLYKGKLVSLTAAEYDLVKLFLLNPGQLFTHEELIKKLWGNSYITRSNVLAVQIRNIRKKIENGEFIETVRGGGYRLLE